MAFGDIILSRLRGTRKTLFGVSKGTLDATALTASRTYTLPDRSGTLTVDTFDALSDYTRAINFASAGTTFGTADTRQLWFLQSATAFTVSVPNPNTVDRQAFAFENSGSAMVTIDALSWLINGQRYRLLAPGDAVVLRAVGGVWRREPGTLKPLTCRRYLTSAQSLTANVDARLLMGTLDYDPSGLMTGSGASAGGISIPRPGYYTVTLKVPVQAVGGGGVPANMTLNAYVQKNQAAASITTGVVTFVNLPIVGPQFGSAVWSQTVLLAAGDYLHLGATASQAVSVNPGVLGCSLEVTEVPGW